MKCISKKYDKFVEYIGNSIKRTLPVSHTREFTYIETCTYNHFPDVDQNVGSDDIFDRSEVIYSKQWN